MPTVNAAKVIRRVRRRLELSQEGLSRLLNATKGAVQHWERGRNNPDLGRLMALRQLCPPAPERKELDALIKQTQARVAPLFDDKRRLGAALRRPGLRGRFHFGYPNESITLLQRENHRLRRQVARLQASLERRGEKLRILEDVATDFQRQLAGARAAPPEKPNTSRSPATPSGGTEPGQR